MLEFDGFFGLLLVALWIHAIVDVVRADEHQIRHLPKQTWLLIVISLPDIGALVWMAAGRPERPVARFPEYNARPARRPIGPEDRADYAAWVHRTRAAGDQPDDARPAEPDRKDEPPAG